MKKTCIVLAVILAVATILACELQFPKALEIRAVPSLDIRTVMDLSKTFKTELMEALQQKDTGGIEKNDKKITLSKMSDGTLVLVARMEVYNETTRLQEELKKVLDNIINAHTHDPTYTVDNWGNIPSEVQATLSNIVIPNSEPILSSNDEDSLEENSSGFTTGNLGDDIVKGFRFSEGSGELYIYDQEGSTIAEHLTFKYYINDDPVGTVIEEKKKINGVYDEWQYWNSEESADNPFTYKAKYDEGEPLPEELFSSDVALEFVFDVYLKANTRFGDLLELINDAGIIAEIIVWFPMVLEAEDNASYKFPTDNMFGENDLFQRKDDEDQLYKIEVERMNIAIGFTDPVFKGKTLQITSDKSPVKYVNKYTLGDEFVDIAFNETEMAKINDMKKYYPFSPSIEILFDVDDTLRIPWDLKTTRIKLEAKTVIRMDLQ